MIFKIFQTILPFCFLTTVWGKGCVQFDIYSFDKIVSKFDAALIKIDNAYPFGPKHEAFETVCEDSVTAPELIVGEIQVKDYGEKDNEDLAQRYGIEKDNFPTVLLFIKGEKGPVYFKESEETPLDAVNLKKFLKLNTKIYIGLPGCIKHFDLLVQKFTQSELEAKKKLLTEAESMKEKLDSDKDIKSADTYIKVMKKVIEKGDSFVQLESTRVENILKGKLNKQKTLEMQEKINILNSFIVHDEL